MGCSGSKKDVIHADHHNSSNQKAQADAIKPHGDEDEEAHVLSEGKSLNKTALDEITEKKKPEPKPQDKPSTNLTGKDQASHDSKSLSAEAHSKSLVVDHKVSESPSLQVHLKEPNEVNESHETAAYKSKTFKVEFENHPHEFDFSFIEEQKLKEQKEKDLLEEELLKEMSDIN